MRDIGQMVCGTLQIPNKIDKYACALRLTFALVQALDVLIDKLAAIVVDLVLDRIHFLKLGKVALGECRKTSRIQLFDLLKHLLRHADELCGKDKSVIFVVIGILGDIVGKLSDTHDIIEHIVHVGDGLFILHNERGCRELDQIFNRCAVGARKLVISILNILLNGSIFLDKRLKSLGERAHGISQHLARFLIKMCERNARLTHETLVEIPEKPLRRVLIRRLLFSHEQIGKLDKPLCKGKENTGTSDVEKRMEKCNLELIVGTCRRRREDLIKNGLGERHPEGLPAEQEHRKKNRAQTVKQQVNNGSAARIGIGADGRNHSRNAGPDVGTDNDVIDAVPRAADEHTAHCKHDNNTCDRRGRLNNSRCHNSDQKKQERIFDDRERIADDFHDLGMQLRIHGIGHDAKSDKDKAQSRKDITDDFHFLRLGEHRHEHTDDCEHQKKSRDVKGTEGSDPRRDGRTDVGTHDDGGRLKECHDPRIHKADDHDRRRRRALNDHRDGGADADARNAVVCRLVEHALKPAVRKAGHAVRHHIHADEERTKPSAKFKHEI